ncbi:MAG: hypothetical protein A3I66_16335 [Burkholderiales bacterium RIFCSPLOWO2_02_FULL_57_36]|nr:MAG: hypothetical protein A3I66_16335 [Burkholderiales bacterium RIFCSPLOWO2_02_FULL_57_36]
MSEWWKSPLVWAATGRKIVELFSSLLIKAASKLSVSFRKMARSLIALFRIGFAFFGRKKRLSLVLSAWRVFLSEGISGLRRELMRFANVCATYEDWIDLNGTLSSKDRDAIRRHISKLPSHPLISVVIPNCKGSEVWLRHAIESVSGQLYPFWELCIACDASLSQAICRLLEGYAQSDQRIRLIWTNASEAGGGLSNLALESVQGEFVTVMDCDAELAQHALYMIATTLENQSDLDLIYSDEDKLDEVGRHFSPNFKPDWNPDLFLGVNFVSRLVVYRTALVRSVGGFRRGYEGLEDWELALRVTEVIPHTHIHHVPYILYHGRIMKGVGSASIGSEPKFLLAAEEMLSEHLVRTRKSGEVFVTADGSLHIRYFFPSPPPLVSIIIPTRNGLDLLRCCINSLRKKTKYPRYEILVVDNQSDDPGTLNYLRQLREAQVVRVLQFDAPFNYSAINNFAVKEAHGSFVCLMNNDIEVISEGWLDEMVSHAARSEIGAVGAKLLYPDDTIQHAGVLVGMGGCAGHLYAGLPRDAEGYMGRARLTQNLSAVTAACLVVRRSVYEEVRGLDEENLSVAFNDVDFCLRVLERGYRNLWTPFAELYHHESASRGREDSPEKQKRFQRELSYMQQRWGYLFNNDPAHSPNLSLSMSYPQYALNPRTTKPWLEYIS